MSDHPRVLRAIQELRRGATYLNLSSTKIGSEGARAVAAALKETRTLTSLSLQLKEFSLEGAKAVAVALKENRSLTSLTLLGNGVGDEGAEAFAAALERNRSLTSLSLLGNGIGDEGAKAVAAALKVNRSLTSLSLSGNEIGSDGAKAVAEALKENQLLISLDLSGNGVGDEGAKAVAAALKKNQSLTSLDLAYNGFCDKGTKAVAAALTENRSLTSLSLRLNGIGDEGAKAIAAAMKVNQSLTSLDLSGNEIGDEGAKAVAAVLKENQSLISLDLSYNGFGDESAKAVAAALTENRSLRSLSLRLNGIGDEGAKAIAAAMKVNQSLTSLDLSSNGIGNETSESEIASYLQRNSAISPDEAWQEAVQAAIRENDEHAWGRVKLMVVGQGGAGKTSTVRSLLGRTYKPDHVSTEVVDLHRTRAKDFVELSDDAEEFDMQVRKAALRRIRPKAEVKHKSIRRKVFSAIRRSAKHASSTLSGKISSKSMPQAVLANEDEIARRFQLTKDDKKLLQKASGDNASLDFDLSFTIWDYGGQDVFYALHHIFLTNMGIYLVVFDMQDLLNQKSKPEAVSYLRFWLNSIHLHAPDSPIIMVGTYFDQIKDTQSLNRIARILREDVCFGNYRGCIVSNSNGRPFFELDNSSPDLDRAVQLRQVIVDAAMKQDYTKQKVPLAWLKVQEVLLQQKKPYLLYEEVVKVAAQYGRCGEDVDDMLNYFHMLGVVVHLRSTEDLQRVVILEPQWLLDKLARVIADDIHIQQIYRTNDLRIAGVEEDFDRLRRDAIATHSLLAFLWEYEEVDYLIRFMRENMLLSDWSYNRKAKETEYLVTGLLSDSQRHVDTSKFKPGLTCELDFSAFYLPNGVFQRLVRQCAAHAVRPDVLGDAPLVTPVLDSCTAKFAFGYNSFIISIEGDCLRIEIHKNALTPATVIKFLVSMFREQNEVLFKHLKWDLVLFGPKSKEKVLYEDLEEARQSYNPKVASVDGDFLSVEEFAPFFDENIGRLDTDEDGTNLPSYEIPQLNIGEVHHVFLSHIESTGGNLAELLSEKLSHRGLKVWLSQEYRMNLNQQAMIIGVQQAHIYVLVLTKGVFSSNAVCVEFQAALNARKPILLVHESESQRSSFAPFSEYINSVPSFCANLFREKQSLPVRHLWYEQEAFLAEFIRRCNEA